MPLSSEAKLAIGVGVLGAVVLGGMGIAAASTRPAPAPPPGPPPLPPAPGQQITPAAPSVATDTTRQNIGTSTVTTTPAQTPASTPAPHVANVGTFDWNTVQPATPGPGSSYTPPPTPDYQTGADVARAQRLLNFLGYNAGVADGVNGLRTQAAVRQFQTDTGLAVDGQIGSATLVRLGQAAQVYGEQHPNLTVPT